MSDALNAVQGSVSIRAWVLDRAWPVAALTVAFTANIVWVVLLTYGILKLGAMLL